MDAADRLPRFNLDDPIGLAAGDLEISLENAMEKVSILGFEATLIALGALIAVAASSVLLPDYLKARYMTFFSHEDAEALELAQKVDRPQRSQ